MENKVLIFGHRNPDTDSICSSMVHEILDKNTICFRLSKNRST